MHTPVLLKEVIDLLNIQDGFKMVDATAGGGGYIKEVINTNPSARILAIDLDQTTLDKLKTEFAKSGLDQKVKLVAGNFADLDQIVEENNFDNLDAVLLDLGFSSLQLDDPQRGLSFQAHGPLDMRFNQSQRLTASEVLNTYPETKLNKIFTEYGEETFSKKITFKIILQRQTSPFTSTDQVFDVIKNSLPKSVRHKAADSARRIFQAIRIEVNNELENLKKVLPKAVGALKVGGRLLVISFHSLEDRIVKQYFVEQSKGCVCPPEFPVCICTKASKLKVLTRKPIIAKDEEININPRSRPAKLRAAEKLH